MAPPVAQAIVVQPTHTILVGTCSITGSWRVRHYCCFCPVACMCLTAQARDADSFRVSGCGCGCLVPCPVDSTFKRRADRRDVFDEHNCCGCKTRHPWHFTAQDTVVSAEPPCGGPPCCGFVGHKAA